MADVDIGAELYEKIKAEFDKSIAENKTIQDFLKKIENGAATMLDMSHYIMSLGDTLAEALKKHITQEALPDGKLYYNIADKILTPMMEQTHTLVNYRAAEVQRVINKVKGIGIEPQKAVFPAERVKSIVNGAAHAKDWETTVRRLDSPVRNAVNSYLDDFVETNADFAYKSGLNAYIIRQDSSKCCKWCAGLAGKYRYPDEVPADVYRRHDNCTCTVTFVSEKGLQNVWSKEKWKPTDERVEQMKAIQPKVTRLSPNDVDKTAESGIIKTENNFVENDFKTFNNGDEVNEFFGGKGGILQKQKSPEKRWLKSLTKDESAYVGSYTADGYDDVNKYLRNIDDDINEAYVQTAVKNIDSAISKFELKENITLFRGTDVDSLIELFPDADDLAELIGCEYSDKGYMSTAPLEKVAKRFAEDNDVGNQLILQLDVTKGNGKGAYINSLSGQYKNDEYEFLIKRDSKFKIYAVDDSGDIPVLKARWVE